MKKKILFGVLFFIMPISVFADVIKIDCPTEVRVSSEFICTVSGNTMSTVTSLSAIVNYDKLTLLEFVPNSLWEGDGLSGKIDLYTINDIKNNFDIGMLKFKSTQVGTFVVSIDSVVYYDELDKEISVSIDNDTVKVINNINSGNVNDDTTNNIDKDDKNENDVIDIINKDNNLIDIVIDNYEINFDKNVYQYTVKIKDETKLNIVPVLNDNSSKYEIIGNDNLVDGSIIEILVTSDDNNISYKIVIDKDNNISDSKDYTWIFILIIGILLFINIIRLIVVNKKKNK